MYRFYINKNLIIEKNYFLLPQNIIHHINVLRIQNHENIILFNGDGNDYYANIIRITKNNVKVKIVNNYINNNESNIKINLIQSLPTINKFELIIQKSTELGINNIYPIISEKSNSRISIFEKKIIRWQSIIHYACEQCGRSIIPKIHQLQSLQNILNNFPKSDISMVLTPKKTHKININKNVKLINILIGSEAGFSIDENNTMIKNNIIPLNLGTRILRTETAAIATIVYLQTKFGDFRM